MKQIILTILITGSFFYCCKIGQIPTNEVNITLIDSITILNHQIDKLPEIYRDHQYLKKKKKIQAEKLSNLRYYGCLKRIISKCL